MLPIGRTAHILTVGRYSETLPRSYRFESHRIKANVSKSDKFESYRIISQTIMLILNYEYGTYFKAKHRLETDIYT